eukprot:757126-Hanusia_phi.AAC.1
MAAKAARVRSIARGGVAGKEGGGLYRVGEGGGTEGMGGRRLLVTTRGRALWVVEHRRMVFRGWGGAEREWLMSTGRVLEGWGNHGAQVYTGYRRAGVG